MAWIEFSRLSVLLVEDNPFARNLFASVLRALGIMRILNAKDGEEAIKILSGSYARDYAMGRGAIDLVIVDYFMPSLNGVMFLRWLRQSTKSPNRFMPFIMTSGATELGTLFSARDAGMDEFLSKPFSAKNLTDRLVGTIVHRRHYILAPSYFGPDRRRRKSFVELERRKTNENDIEIISSHADLKTVQQSNKLIWVYKLPNLLKLRTMTTTDDDGGGFFDASLLAAAEQKITNMESDYTDWSRKSVDEAVQAHRRAVARANLAEARDDVTTIHRIALELRGQGGIFGYPLMTQFGKSLYEITGEETDITPQMLDLSGAHLDLIKIVMRDKIKGSGGATGQQLVHSLLEAKKKFATSSAQARSSKPATVLPPPQPAVSGAKESTGGDAAASAAQRDVESVAAAAAEEEAEAAGDTIPESASEPDTGEAAAAKEAEADTDTKENTDTATDAAVPDDTESDPDPGSAVPSPLKDDKS